MRLAILALFISAAVLQAQDAAKIDYPKNRTGVMVLSSEWMTIPGEKPTKTRMKHGFAPALTYGIAPATFVTEYEGQHAQLQIQTGRPVICVCNLISIPGNPILVRLTANKTVRQLNGGNLHIGAKVFDAKKSDLIPVNVSQPTEMVWIVEPQQPLPVGEYALMLGTQNAGIFSFGVSAAAVAKTPIPSESAPTEREPTALAGRPRLSRSLVNSDVIQMAKAGLGDGVILKAIQSHGTAFDLSTEALIELKGAGVSEVIIEEMLNQETSH
jgi:hypothetical protein